MVLAWKRPAFGETGNAASETARSSGTGCFSSPIFGHFDGDRMISENPQTGFRQVTRRYDLPSRDLEQAQYRHDCAVVLTTLQSWTNQLEGTRDG